MKKKEENRIGKIKAVMFVPYTHYSGLARDLRQAEEKLLDLTGYKIKVVKRAAMKLDDLLHKSNPWQGLDCNRELCLLCKTKETTKKNKEQECSKRSLVYEIWCPDCEREKEERVKRESGEDGKLMRGP